MFHVKHFSKNWGARIRTLVLGALLVTFLASCVVSESPISGRKRAYGYSWEQEQQIGKEADPQIVSQYGVYKDEKLSAYVDRVAQQVLSESHLRRPDTDEKFRNTPFTFRILDSPIINAFALPGGFVYVTRGLIANAENEAQLAVVLGHEIGHVAARHSSQRALETQLGQVGLIGGAILGQEVLGLPGQDILNMGSQAAQLLFLKYGRDDEREADKLGVEYAALSTYEAAEGAAFFHSLKRMQQQQANELPSFLSTHPDPGEREQSIVQMASEWDKRTTMNKVNRDEYLSHVDGIVVGEDPRQGFVRDGIFYHPELRFRLPVPSGFQVINQPQQVVMAEPNGQAYLVLSLAQAASAQAAAAALAKQQGLNVRDSGQTRANGLTGYYVLGDAQMSDGTNVSLLNYFVEYGKQVYSILGLAAQQGFSSFQQTFEKAMNGFGPETSQSILNVKPLRINVVPASQTAAFSTFLPKEIPFGVTAEDFAIMNQVELNERIAKGTLLKLPQ